MAAKEIVCVNPSENRVRPQTVGVGLAVMMNVLQNDSKMAASRTADNSRPAALMIGVWRWRQNTKATASVIIMPVTKAIINFDLQ